MKRGFIADWVVSRESANRASRYGVKSISGESVQSGVDDKGSAMYTSPVNQSVPLHVADCKPQKKLAFPLWCR